MIISLATFLLMACFIWAVVGSFSPNTVLWWAREENRNSWRAILFALTCALICFAVRYAAREDGSVYDWFLVMVSTAPVQICFQNWKIKTQADIDKEKEEKAIRKAKEWQQKAALTQTVYSQKSGKRYEIHPAIGDCSCPDWQETRWDANGPFRLCKHLTAYYAIHKDELPDDLKVYEELITAFGIDDKGIPHRGDVLRCGVIADMPYIVTADLDRLPWVNIYADFETERYGFNIKSGRWARGNEPPLAEILAEELQKSFREFLR